MKYNGKELVEMTSANWDGNTREMLVWSDYDAKPTLALVCGFTRKGHPIADTRKKSDGFKRFNVFQHCAEIPKEESIEDLKEQVERLKADNKNLCYLFNDKSADYEKLLEENKELKEKLESLRDKRSDMANAVSSAVWKELMAKAAADQFSKDATPGFGITNITALVLNKILEYKPEKKVRRMTYKELDDWLEKGKGVFRLADRVSDNISYDCEDRNNEVAGYYKICGYDEDTWHEPLIEE